MNKNDLIRIVGNIHKDFTTDKLAYLAVTRKAERPLQDSIAFHMHQIMQNNHHICLESDRFDIVALIHRPLTPEIIIECKAHSSINYPKFCENEMKKDINGMCDHAQINHCNPDLYFVFFNNIIKSRSIPSIPPNLYIPIKYDIQVLYHIGDSYIDKVKRVINNWVRLLNTLKLPINLTTIVEIPAGNYYTIPVSILAFIYGPFHFEKDAVDLSLNDGCRVAYPKNAELREPNEIDFYYRDKNLENISIPGLNIKTISLLDAVTQL